jgi:hypothetical protein
LRLGWSIWFLVLVGSLALWQASLFLHTHPWFISALFNWNKAAQ